MSTETLYLYDQVLEGLIRLIGHSKAEDLQNVSDVVEDMDYLVPHVFRKDILLLAASVRNLAESTSTKDIMKKHLVVMQGMATPFKAPFFGPSNSTVHLYSVASRILHSLRIVMLRNAREVPSSYTEADAVKDYMEIQRRPATAFPAGAYVWINSDKDGITVFNLNDIYNCIVNYLNEFTQIMDKKGLILNKSQRDT